MLALGHRVTLLVVTTWQQFHEDHRKIVPNVSVNGWLSTSQIFIAFGIWTLTRGH